MTGQYQNNPPDCAATVTRLLKQASEGDLSAAADLLPLVYEELRALARQRMRQERAGLTLEATALVHEAYVRLVDRTQLREWNGRSHFFAAAAEAMRKILVDGARRRGRLKRGGDRQRLNMDDFSLTVADPPDELLALDEALNKLAEKHPEKAKLVKLRYFAGMKNAEAAEALGIAASTADRYWAFARAWLHRQIASQRS